MGKGLEDEIRDSLGTARKARDKPRTLVLSTVLSDVRNRQIADRSEAGDDLVREVLARAIKQRRDTADQMRSAGREELAAAEEVEASILGEFLPPELSQEDVRGIIRELVAGGATEMGPLMGQLMPRIRGRFGGREANRIVREELAT